MDDTLLKGDAYVTSVAVHGRGNSDTFSRFTSTSHQAAVTCKC